ncbi:hypothetical protein Hanom_Chr06g00565231 [Helianthus anomalus]
MVGFGLGHLLTRGMRAPLLSPHSYVFAEYDRAWVGLGLPPPPPPRIVTCPRSMAGRGLGAPRGRMFKIKKKKLFTWPAMTWRGQRIRNGQLGCQDRPTLGLKPKPQGPRPNPSPPGVMAWAFSPNPRPNPHPNPSPP